MFYSPALNIKSKKYRNFFKKYKTGGSKNSRKSMEFWKPGDLGSGPVLPVINCKATSVKWEQYIKTPVEFLPGQKP